MPMRLPSSLSTSTIGSENSRTMAVPRPIIQYDRILMRACCCAGDRLSAAMSSGISSSSSSSSSASPPAPPAAPASASSPAADSLSSPDVGDTTVSAPMICEKPVRTSVPRRRLPFSRMICTMAVENSSNEITPSPAVSMRVIRPASSSFDGRSPRSCMRSLSSAASMLLSPFLSYLLKNLRSVAFMRRAASSLLSSASASPGRPSSAS
mmetsp:Transcript_13961/g.48644  ORF Transcript_13961/g.48644 Transcript_13961/m.48644 type:complete len:209 (-) Transcript_13961:790-1416(-)